MNTVTIAGELLELYATEVGGTPKVSLRIKAQRERGNPLYFTIDCWDDLARRAGRIPKGWQVVATGSLSNYKGKDGQVRTCVRANSVFAAPPDASERQADPAHAAPDASRGVLPEVRAPAAPAAPSIHDEPPF